MESSLRTCSKFVTLLILLALVPSCKKGGDIVDPAPVDWEGHAPNFNEAYRDTIITLAPGGLMLMHKDGSAERVVREHSAYISFASWSPRKWKIYFAEGLEIPGRGNNLYIMNADGSDPHLVTTRREYYLQAVMSPDGQKIAYIAIDTTDAYGNKGTVKVMNPDGTGVRELTARIVGIDGVTWSPDSRQVVYSGQDSLYGGINIVSIDGTGRRVLYFDKMASCDYPALSPDGSLLAFSSAVGGVGNPKILLLNMQTLTHASLTSGTAADAYPTWSTDSRQVIYVSSPGGGQANAQLWKTDAGGQHQASITSPQAAYGKPCWYK